MVLSEAAATCMVNTIANSKIGTITLDKEKFNTMFDLEEEFEFDSTSIGEYIPVLVTKVG